MRAFSSIRIAVLVIALAGVSCSSPMPPTIGVPVPLTRFDSRLVGSLLFTGYDQPTTLIVRDQATWRATWQQLHVHEGAPPLLPDIDFSTEMVVLAAAGTEPSSGYDILFTGASKGDGVVTIDTLTLTPSGCAVALALTQPADLARLPRHDGSVVFRLTSAVHVCG